MAWSVSHDRDGPMTDDEIFDRRRDEFAHLESLLQQIDSELRNGRLDRNTEMDLLDRQQSCLHQLSVLKTQYPDIGQVTQYDSDRERAHLPMGYDEHGARGDDTFERDDRRDAVFDRDERQDTVFERDESHRSPYGQGQSRLVSQYGDYDDRPPIRYNDSNEAFSPPDTRYVDTEPYSGNDERQGSFDETLDRQDNFDEPTYRNDRYEDTLEGQDAHRYYDRQERNDDPMHRQDRHDDDMHRQDRHDDPMHRQDNYDDPMHRQDNYDDAMHRQDRYEETDRYTDNIQERYDNDGDARLVHYESDTYRKKTDEHQGYDSRQHVSYAERPNEVQQYPSVPEGNLDNLGRYEGRPAPRYSSPLYDNDNIDAVRREDRDDRSRHGKHSHSPDRQDDRRGDKYGDRHGDKYDDRQGDRHGDKYDDRQGDRHGDKYDDRQGDKYDDRSVKWGRNSYTGRKGDRNNVETSDRHTVRSRDRSRGSDRLSDKTHDRLHGGDRSRSRDRTSGKPSDRSGKGQTGSRDAAHQERSRQQAGTQGSRGQPGTQGSRGQPGTQGSRGQPGTQGSRGQKHDSKHQTSASKGSGSRSKVKHDDDIVADKPQGEHFMVGAFLCTLCDAVLLNGRQELEEHCRKKSHYLQFQKKKTQKSGQSDRRKDSRKY